MHPNINSQFLLYRLKTCINQSNNEREGEEENRNKATCSETLCPLISLSEIWENFQGDYPKMKRERKRYRKKNKKNKKKKTNENL